MILRVWYLILACIVIVLVADFTSGKNQSFYGTQPMVPFGETIFVSNSIQTNSGRSNFSTIQSAIDYVPQNNKQWICIYLFAGIYREKVLVPVDKPYIYFHGEGKRKTFIVWDDHESIATSPTFASEADNIVARSITFLNSYNNPPNVLNPRRTAVAAFISGDKTAFYHCRFLGFQDTLWDSHGRHYFKECTIQGAVDFIFGSGRSIYEKCTISVLAATLDGPGYITAQGRKSSKEKNGFVFKECNVIGNGLAYLGRPWRQYATVIFYNSNLTEVVHPEGWNLWNNDKGKEKRLTYVEHNCYGAGSDTKKRVKWEKRLSANKLRRYTSISYIDKEGWMRNLPFNILG